MPVKLPTFWIITLNVIGWPVIHVIIASIFTGLPRRLFERSPRDGADRSGEAYFYEHLLKIRKWKSLLPDGAPWFRGFAKRKLQSTNPAYVQAFIAETRRGEAAHWTMLCLGAVFFLWNPLWADAVMFTYAIAANVPCIITQRYNRRRLERLRMANRFPSLLPRS